MAPRRKPSSSHGRGKRHFDANEHDERRKPQFDRGLFSSRSMYERYKSYFFNKIILPGRDIDFVQHNIGSYSLVPRGGHKNEVSYLEAFLIYSIIVGRLLNIGYIIMNHIATCCERKTRILPYGRIMTKVFKAFGIEFTLNDEVEEPSPYDTYKDMSMR